MPHVLIIGGGFAGLNVAKGLGGLKSVEVTLVDRTNHHLFQPLLYQVAMAGLSPADIAVPIRSLLSKYQNIRVLQGEVLALELSRNAVVADFGEVAFDYLIMACGARHSYFGHDEWEGDAPGQKPSNKRPRSADVSCRPMKPRNEPACQAQGMAVLSTTVRGGLLIGWASEDVGRGRGSLFRVAVRSESTQASVAA